MDNVESCAEEGVVARYYSKVPPMGLFQPYIEHTLGPIEHNLLAGCFGVLLPLDQT